MTMEQLAMQLLGLPAKARAILAEKLIASLEDEQLDGDVDGLWAEEAERRLQEAEQDAASLLPADAVFKDARSRLKR